MNEYESKIYKEYQNLLINGNVSDFDNFFQDSKKVRALSYGDMSISPRVLLQNNKTEELKTVFSYVVNLQLTPYFILGSSFDFLRNTVMESINNQNVDLIKFIYNGEMETYINEKKEDFSVNKIINFVKSFPSSKCPTNPHDELFNIDYDLLSNAARFPNKEIFETIWDARKEELNQVFKDDICRIATYTKNEDFIEYVNQKMNNTQTNINELPQIRLRKKFTEKEEESKPVIK